MKGQQLPDAVRTMSGRPGNLTKILTSTLSLLIFSLYIEHPARAMDAVCPPTSPGFHRIPIYAATPQTIMNALGATLKALSIPMVSTQNLQVVTGIVDGPVSPPDSKGQVTSTRFHFKIQLSPINGQIDVNIFSMIDTATAPAGTPPTQWHDVTLFHYTTDMGCNHWLLEALDNTLNGRPPAQTAREQLARLGGTMPAGAVSLVGAPPRPQAGSGTKFDGGLGSSGDIGGGSIPNGTAPSRAGNH